jgi:tetratricopeptide (TPR) repeat protein
LLAAGDNAAAASEFQQAIALSPGQVPVMIELADALEKKGDWAESLEEYHKAALLDSSADYRTKITRMDAADPQVEYKKAQERLQLHIAALKSSGKSSDAAALEARAHNLQAAPRLSEKIDAAMQAGEQANRVRHFDEALKHFQDAVELAEKVQPHDPRLVTALDHVGNEYLGQDPAAAEAAYERELKVSEEIFGAHSANTAMPLQSLGRNALMQHDYAAAEKFYFREVDVNEKVYGEGSDRVAASLLDAASVYMAQKDYAKAEPYILRSVHIDESLYGHDGINMLMPLSNACNLYDKWGKPDKLEPYTRQLIAVAEKQFGPNSPQLAPVLSSEARTLRTLGRAKEAADMENRLASIRSATMSTP